MRTKNSLTKKSVPSLYVNFTSEQEFNYEFETVNMKEYIFSTTYQSILTAHKKNKTTALICEVNYSGKYSALHKSDWANALNSAMDFYVVQENYEQCGKIRDLMFVL